MQIFDRKKDKNSSHSPNDTRDCVENFETLNLRPHNVPLSPPPSSSPRKVFFGSGLSLTSVSDAPSSPINRRQPHQQRHRLYDSKRKDFVRSGRRKISGSVPFWKLRTLASEDFDPSRLTERQQLAYFAAKSEGKLELSPFRLDRLMVDNFDDSVCTAKIGNVRIKDLMNSSSKNRRQKKINSVDQTIAVTDSRHDSSNFDEKKSVFAKNRIENCESIFESIVDECVMTDNVLVENVSVLSTSHSFDTFDSLMMDNFCSDRIDIFDSDVEYLNQNGTESSHQNLVEVFSACKDNSLKMGETSSENLKTTTSFIAQVAECQLVSMNKIIQDAEKNELYFDLHQNPCNALSAADYRLPELDNCIHPSYPTDQKEHQEVYRDICHAAVYIPEKNKEPNLLEFALLKFHQSYLEIRARREEIAKIDGAKSKCST